MQKDGEERERKKGEEKSDSVKDINLLADFIETRRKFTKEELTRITNSISFI